MRALTIGGRDVDTATPMGPTVFADFQIRNALRLIGGGEPATQVSPATAAG